MGSELLDLALSDSELSDFGLSDFGLLDFGLLDFGFFPLPRLSRNSKPAGPAKIAGSNIKSPNNAVNSMIMSNDANLTVGINTPNKNGNTPSPQIKDVSIIALAQCSNANRIEA